MDSDHAAILVIVVSCTFGTWIIGFRVIDRIFRMNDPAHEAAPEPESTV